MDQLSVEINISEIHIRAALKSHRWNPAEIAILQQTSYMPVGFFDDQIRLMNEHGVEFTCPVSEALGRFLDLFSHGQAVLPGIFTLSCAPLN